MSIQWLPLVWSPGAVVDGSDDCEAIEAFGLFREELADGDAGDGRRDGFEGAAELAGGVGFGVPGFHVAGAAAEPEEDDAFAGGLFDGGGGGLEFEQAGKGEAAQGACLEEASSG